MSKASDLAALGIADTAHSLCRDDPSAEIDAGILHIEGAAIKLDLTTDGKRYHGNWLSTPP